MNTNTVNGNNSASPELILNYYIIRKSLWSPTFYLNRYGAVVWMVLGLILNPLALITWTRPRLRRHNASSNYLVGIAVADFLFWVLYLLHYLKMFWNISVQDAPVWCELFQGLFLSIQYFSVPLVLVFSIERYIAVCHPFKRDKLCTHRRALINTIGCGVTVFIIGFIQMAALRYNSVTEKCDVREEVLLSMYWRIFQMSIEILISAVLPFATLIVNILVILELRKITEKGNLLKPSLNKQSNTGTSNTTSSDYDSSSKLNPDTDTARYSITNINNNNNNNNNFDFQSSNKKLPNTTTNKERNAFRSSTILLLSVSFLLIFTTLPVGFVYALQFIAPNGNETYSLAQMKEDPTWISFANYQIAKELVDLFAQIHFVINFVIYYVTGDNFRDEFHQMIDCSRRKSLENTILTNSYTMTSATADRPSQHRRINRTELIRRPMAKTSNKTDVIEPSNIDDNVNIAIG